MGNNQEKKSKHKKLNYFNIIVKTSASAFQSSCSNFTLQIPKLAAKWSINPHSTSLFGPARTRTIYLVLQSLVLRSTSQRKDAGWGHFVVVPNIYLRIYLFSKAHTSKNKKDPGWPSTPHPVHRRTHQPSSCANKATDSSPSVNPSA